jgi:hypothetical protein
VLKNPWRIFRLQKVFQRLHCGSFATFIMKIGVSSHHCLVASTYGVELIHAVAIANFLTLQLVKLFQDV